MTLVARARRRHRLPGVVDPDVRGLLALYAVARAAAPTAVFLGLALTSAWMMPLGAIAARAAGSTDPGAMLSAVGPRRRGRGAADARDADDQLREHLHVVAGVEEPLPRGARRRRRLVDRPRSARRSARFPASGSSSTRTSWSSSARCSCRSAVCCSRTTTSAPPVHAERTYQDLRQPYTTNAAPFAASSTAGVLAWAAGASRRFSRRVRSAAPCPRWSSRSWSTSGCVAVIRTLTIHYA